MIVAWTIGLVLMAGSTIGARAQVAVMVNGDPVTEFDITQRQKLTELSTHKPPPRQEALDELIDEKLKLQIAKRYVIDISEKDVNGAFAGMAQRAGLTTQQFTQALTQAGISVSILKTKIKADISWNAIVRGKFPSTFLIPDKDIQAAVASRKKDDKPQVANLYSLRQVLFIAPRGIPDSVLDARRKEAEALRARFQSCDDGVAIAQAIKDVAVRNPVNRSSVDIPSKQREILESTPIGHLTPPEVTALGVEMFAVCSKQEIRGDSADEHEVRDEMVMKRYEVQSKRYLRELRQNAMIEVR